MELRNAFVVFPFRRVNTQWYLIIVKIHEVYLPKYTYLD